MSYRPSAEMGARDALRAEVERLRADLATVTRQRDDARSAGGSYKRQRDRLTAALADARERLAAAYALIEEYDPDRAAQARALSAGSGDLTGGDGDEM